MADKRSMGPGRRVTKNADPNLTYVCPHCGKEKLKRDFYVSHDPAVSIGISFPCKKCAELIARNYSPARASFGDVTKRTLQNALEYLDLPYLDKLWEAAIAEVNNVDTGKAKSNVWASYIKNVTSLKQYSGMRWRDGDVFQTTEESVVEEDKKVEKDPEVMIECEKNRKDIIRLIGYDPFEQEAEEDKPLLYAQLIGYLDMSGDNEDMTRILDSIEIVRGYLQLQKLNDMSSKAFASLSKTGHSGEIKNYMDTKKKVADVISQLAEQSCISMKHNKNASKGENTFTGKTKRLRDMDLREMENNAFDIGTCKGMQQVADISNASIIKQIHLDENDYTEMLARQREIIVDLQKLSDENAEKARILLRENIDLKNFLSDQGIDIESMCDKETILYQEEEDESE